MTDQIAEPTVTAPTNNLSEIEILKRRADTLGIKYHPKIGVDTLRAKLDEITKETLPEVSTITKEVITKETMAQMQARKRKEALRLIRVRITCMDPNKKGWEGEIFTVSNSVVGTVKKYIPYNAEEGWHVPQIILNVLEESKCQTFITVTNRKGGKDRKGKLVKKFAIQRLTPLNDKELKDLADRQALGHNIG